MKTNKKAILGFAVAMVFSLAFMQGISNKNNIDQNNQQVGVACTVVAANSEGGTAGAWYAASGVAYGFAVNVAYGAAVNSWNPAGWVGWAVAGGSAL
ncbi:MAG: hypothetical protein JEZ09_18230 [Salinivirgaceae bacterium]|nr:hypothetical protein [Salinivirgaceae bacterium]